MVIPLSTSSTLISCWIICCAYLYQVVPFMKLLQKMIQIYYKMKYISIDIHITSFSVLVLNEDCLRLRWRRFWTVMLISREGLEYVFYEVCFLLWEFVTTFYDDFVSCHTVVRLVVNQFVLMWVYISFVLFVPVLSTHSHCYSLVDESMLDNSPKKLVPLTCDSDNSSFGWTE